jgi:hypothetical protein
MRAWPLVGLLSVGLLSAGCRRQHAPAEPAAPPSVSAASEEAGDLMPAPGPNWDPPPPPTPRSRAADAGTANGDPNGPRAEALNAIVDAALPQMRACLDKTELPDAGALQLSIAYSIQPTGQTSGVTPSGNAAAPALACLRAVFEGLRFPTFAGPPLKGSFPLSYRRQ